MAKGKKIEIVKMALSGRGIADVGRIFREQLKKQTGEINFAKLDLGIELPEKFLQLNGPQPTLAELTVLANKLKMQIRITHIELEALNYDRADKNKSK